MTTAQHAHLEDFSRTLNYARFQAVEDAFRQAVETIGWDREQLERWDQLPDNDVSKAGWQAVAYRVGLALAQRAEADTQLAYHNRTHTAEVVLAAGLLATAEFPQAQDRRNEGLKLLAAMAGHDLEHEGYVPGQATGTMEAHSASILEKTFMRFSSRQSQAPVLEEMKQAILGTEFMHGPKTNARLLQANPANERIRLAVLANEADTLPSLLPWTGVTRGRQLAQEWRDKCHPGASGVASDPGRLGFLRSLPLASSAAQKLGLMSLRDMQVAEIEERIRPQAATSPVRPKP